MSQRIYAVLGTILILSLTISTLQALVPPNPMYRHVPAAYERTRPELPGTFFSEQTREIPNNILVLRVQFSDLSFVQTPAFPDSLAHNDAFFDRWMLHLADFYSDASHGRYQLSYTLWDQVFTMSHPLAYYGGDTDDYIDARSEEMIAELIQLADPQIDFTQYGGIIVFHAGPGQEADTSGIRTDTIWSTFVTRKNLQDALDPENDNYPGIATADGINLKNIVLVPESEFHDYFPLPPDPNSGTYLFSIYGVLAHQYGHLIGLPTLFDNDSGNGVSQGIGNWGLMGTGVWNASGYVPAQLCAWSRYHLGWEDAVTLTGDMQGLQLDYFQNHNTLTPRLYKVPISANEYFLLENRQQNPDDSVDPYSGAPSYSFNLLPEGEQDYYPDYPLLPFFNFMENRYKGSEWDFMLPGLGGPLLPGQSQPLDGSGMLIWHIDENVIAANFDTGFEMNRVNADASHKGVDLEEADGIEQLDTGLFDYYKYGGPNDSFRPGNNDYFGNSVHNGLLSLPNAVSYYGGYPLEIYDISQVDKKMIFSVRFGWKLEANYTGINTINAAMIDLDRDGTQEIFQPLPDGQIYIWKNEALMPGYPVAADTLAQTFTWDGSTAYLPVQRQNLVRLRSLDQNGIETLFNLPNYSWASHPVDAGNELLLPFNKADGTGEYDYLDKATGQRHPGLYFSEQICANLIYANERVWALTRHPGQAYTLNSFDVNGDHYTGIPLVIPADSLVVSMFMAPFTRGEGNDLILQTEHAVYVYDDNLNPVPGFPFIHDEVVTAPLSFADYDKNGYYDILLGTSSGAMVIDYAGRLMGTSRLVGSSADSLSSGVRALDIDHDGQLDIIGNFSNNRLGAWNENYVSDQGFPVSFSERSRHLPLVGKASDDLYYLWTASDNGKIFRKEIPGYDPADADTTWFTEYGNLRRTAFLDVSSFPNQFLTDKTFVPGEVYIYPNPLKTYHGDQLVLNVMTSRNTQLNLKIYDISGALVYSGTGMAKAYLQNRDLFILPAGKLHSGIYIAVVSSDRGHINLKFAVEK